MMKIFVLNCGSSSIKFQFINTESGEVLAKGLVERIGEDMGIYTYKSQPYTKKNLNVFDRRSCQRYRLHLERFAAHQSWCDSLGERNWWCWSPRCSWWRELLGVGDYRRRCQKAIRDCFEIAPLHNPANMMGVTPWKMFCQEFAKWQF